MSSIGEIIKELRNEKNMTLKELSQKTNLSASFLSQFERGISTIAVDALIDVADALDVDLVDIIEPVRASKQPADPVVLHSYQQTMTQLHSEHQIQTNLSAWGKDKVMLARKITLLPNQDNASQTPTPYSHQGEEFLYVIEGVLSFIVDDCVYQLYPGDTAHLPSSRKHIWFNNTNRNVVFLIVNYPSHQTPADKNQEIKNTI